MPETHPAQLARVDAALKDVAYLVTQNPRYLPIFERLLEEHRLMLKHDDLISRAHAISAASQASQNKRLKTDDQERVTQSYGPSRSGLQA